MIKTKKELAYLRELTVAKDWTERFTSLSDKHLKLPAEGNFLYFNSGTLAHALELREKLEKDINLICVSDDEELKKIAQAKASATKTKIKLNQLKDLESEFFDYVLADFSFTPAIQIAQLLDELVFLTKKGGEISFFLPTSGSFGEIFSFLWETLLDTELIEKSVEIERLINNLPKVFDLEETAKNAGLKSITVHNSTEIFEYKTGADFISSNLVSDFLLPVWLNFLSSKELKRASTKLVQLIDEEYEELSFRFSVKAAVISGIKK